MVAGREDILPRAGGWLTMLDLHVEAESTEEVNWVQKPQVHTQKSTSSSEASPPKGSTFVDVVAGECGLCGSVK